MTPKGHGFGEKTCEKPLKLNGRGPRAQKEPMSEKQAPFWYLLAVSAYLLTVPKVA